MTQEFVGLTETLQEMLVDLIRFLPDLTAAVVIFVATLFAAGLISKAVSRGLGRRAVGKAASQLVTKVAYYAVVVIGAITALEQVRFNVTAFLTGLGIVGFTIGFALQDVSKNFVSGLLLLIQQPFYVGDLIEVSGFTGYVQTIDLRATELHTLDGRVVLIPNAEIFTHPITNLSRGTQRRVEVLAKVAIESDLGLVRAAAMEAVQAVPGLTQTPQPEVRFINFGTNLIEVNLYYWVKNKDTDVVAAKDAGIEALKKAFEARGIVLR